MIDIVFFPDAPVRGARHGVHLAVWECVRGRVVREFDWAEQTGSMVFVRAGVPFKSELVNHEECHVRQYESGKPLGEDECYTAMWS